MKHSILLGPSYSLAVVQLEAGEHLRAEAGAMVSMSSTIDLEAKFNTGGKGLFGMLKRTVLGGESLFLSTLTAKTGPGEVTLAPSMPGDILALSLGGETLLAERGAFLAAAAGVDMDTQFSGLKGLMGGEGLAYLRFTGTGTLFLAAFGGIYPRELAPGERYIVDSSHLVAFEERVSYQVRKAASGWISSFTSGEGLVMEFTGPGRIWIQSRNPRAHGEWLSPFLPKASAE
jgi:uncharacterized protein (TIGR00266 family)